MSYFPFLALIRRELISTLRNAKVHHGLILFMLITLAAVGIQWPGADVPLTDVRYYADDLFMGLKLALLLGCILVVPGVAGAAISLEQEQESFDFLYLTLIRPAGIVAAKLIAVVAVFMLLFAAVLPVFGCVFFLVGIDKVEMMSAALMILLFTITCAAWGLFFSALFRRTVFGLTASYLMLLITLGGPLVLVSALAEAFGNWDLASPLRDVLAVVTPIGVLFKDGMAPVEIIFALLFQLVMALVVLAAALARVRRPPAPRPAKAEKPIDDARALELRRRRFPFYLLDPRARKPPIRDRINPVMAKELRFGFMGRAVNLFRLCYISFAVFALTAMAFFLAEGSYGAGTGAQVEQFILSHLLQMLPIAVLAAALAVPAVTRETELGNLDFLRLTLLSPGQIIRGKFLAGAALLAPLVIVMALANAPFLLLLEPDFKVVQVMATVYASFIVCLLLTYSLGLLASAIARKTNTAVMLGYGLAVTVLIGVFLILLFLSEFNLVPDWNEHDLAFLSPITVLIENLDRHCKTWGPREDWQPFSPYFAAGMSAYTLLAAFVALAAARVFARFRMRER